MTKTTKKETKTSSTKKNTKGDGKPKAEPGVTKTSDTKEKVPAGKGQAPAVTPEEGPARQNKATHLVALVERAGVELFQDPDDTEFVAVEVNSHRETWPLDSRGFRTWLAQQAYSADRTTPGRQALDDAVDVLAGKVRATGVTRNIAVRVAGEGEKIFLDLADDEWRAVEIDANGWRVVSRPPVYFRRSRGMLALPEPVRGGSVDELRTILNVGDDRSQQLIVAWLLAALRPTGPYPILVVYGEQGSAKSTTAEGLRFLVDPHTTLLRSLPGNLRDLAVAAHNNWVVGFDNLSNVYAGMSDALCRLATGGGFGTRQNYRDLDEVLVNAVRPILLNGIASEMISRPDLLDRSLVVELPPIPETKRRTKEDVWGDLKAARPRILGALLDAVSVGLRNLPRVKLDRLPRMADLARWGEACGPALGWKRMEFVNTLFALRDEADAFALDLWPVFPHLVAVLGKENEYRGTVGQLLEKLNMTRRNQIGADSRDWPRTAKGLGIELRRYAPSLRRVGIEIEWAGRANTGMQIRITGNPNADVNGPVAA
jgi:hypothetical protein